LPAVVIVVLVGGGFVRDTDGIVLIPSAGAAVVAAVVAAVAAPVAAPADAATVVAPADAAATPLPGLIYFQQTCASSLWLRNTLQFFHDFSHSSQQTDGITAVTRLTPIFDRSDPRLKS
jgi:hypothetical protein